MAREQAWATELARGEVVPTRYIAPGELERLCRAYFAQCEEEGKSPTQPGLAVFLDVTPDRLAQWTDQPEEGREWAAQVLKKALARMSDLLQQRRDSMAVLSLKQPCYGGYGERPAEKGSGVLAVQVSFGAEAGAVAVKYGE